MKRLIALLAIVFFFIFPPVSIIIIIAIVVKSFLDHKRKSDYALSALTTKYIYDNMSKKEKAKIDYEANHIAYEQYIEGTSLTADLDYDEAIKFFLKGFTAKKKLNPQGYWLFLANVFAECQIPNPFGQKWYIARFPFKELVGEEKYAIKGMQEFLKDKYRIEVDINEINDTGSNVPATKEEFGIDIADRVFEDHNFKINSGGWKKITVDGKSYFENSEKDIWEILDGECVGEQLFTWEAAMRETAKAGKRMPTDDEFSELLKVKEDLPNLVFAGVRTPDGLFGDRGTGVYLWSSTNNGHNAWTRLLDLSNSTIDHGTVYQSSGFSVRCLKD